MSNNIDSSNKSKFASKKQNHIELSKQMALNTKQLSKAIGGPIIPYCPDCSVQKPKPKSK